MYITCDILSSNNPNKFWFYLRRVGQIQKEMVMKKKVLICDDEVYLLEAVRYVVSRAGYIPLLAKNGEEALALARRKIPELVILDIMMPKRNGFEVCKILKSDPATKNTYIIMLTAKWNESDSLKGKQCGADEFITKPFSPRKLTQRLQKVLGK